jgi:hypothetical protein
MFLNAIALPLQPLIGVVAAFNVAFLINIPLIGIGMYLLARRAGAPYVGAGEAWLAGLLFACAPYLSTAIRTSRCTASGSRWRSLRAARSRCGSIGRTQGRRRRACSTCSSSCWRSWPSASAPRAGEW